MNPNANSYPYMYNWSVDEEAMKKADPEGYKIWRLEQMIHYAQEGEKINEHDVRANWTRMRDRIDPEYRRYIELLLWPNGLQS